MKLSAKFLECRITQAVLLPLILFIQCLCTHVRESYWFLSIYHCCSMNILSMGHGTFSKSEFLSFTETLTIMVSSNKQIFIDNSEMGQADFMKKFSIG